MVAMRSIRQRRALVAVRVSVLATALLLTACSQGVTVGTGIEGFEEIDPERKAAVEETLPVPEAVAPPADAELASGRDTLAAVAANGEPHILWFWGAN